MKKSVEFHYKHEFSIRITDSYVAENSGDHDYAGQYKSEFVAQVFREYHARLMKCFGGLNAGWLCSELYSKELLSYPVYDMVLESPKNISKALLESAEAITASHDNAKLYSFLNILKEESVFIPLADNMINGKNE